MFRLVFLPLILVLTSLSARADFVITSGAAQHINGFLTLSATLNLGLGNDASEAINSGIPLLIAVQIRLYKKRNYVWDQQLAQWRINREISFHALSGRYIVRSLTQEKFDSFETLSEAATAAGRLSLHWDTSALELTAKHKYDLSLRVFPDFEALPAPLRLAAYLTPTWHLGSDWERWHLGFPQAEAVRW